MTKIYILNLKAFSKPLYFLTPVFYIISSNSFHHAVNWLPNNLLTRDANALKSKFTHLLELTPVHAWLDKNFSVSSHLTQFPVLKPLLFYVPILHIHEMSALKSLLIRDNGDCEEQETPVSFMNLPLMTC